jgi:hypothetical protein
MNPSLEEWEHMYMKKHRLSHNFIFNKNGAPQKGFFSHPTIPIFSPHSDSPPSKYWSPLLTLLTSTSPRREAVSYSRTQTTVCLSPEGHSALKARCNWNTSRKTTVVREVTIWMTMGFSSDLKNCIHCTTTHLSQFYMTSASLNK